MDDEKAKVLSGPNLPRLVKILNCKDKAEAVSESSLPRLVKMLNCKDEVQAISGELTEACKDTELRRRS